MATPTLPQAERMTPAELRELLTSLGFVVGTVFDISQTKENKHEAHA